MDKIEIILPVSHLFKNKKNVEGLRGLYDGLEVRHFTEGLELQNKTFFHADEIQPIHEMKDSEFLFFEKLRKDNEIKFVSFHCASVCKNPKVEDGIFYVGSDSIVYSRDELNKNAEKNLKVIRSILGDDVTLMIENNNFYPTPAYDHVTDADFISELVVHNDINFLYDNAHAMVTSYNKNLKYEKYRDLLPLDKATQIQFCEPFIPNKESKNIARDIHELPSQRNIDEVKTLCDKYNIRYITPEYYRDFELLVRLLRLLRGQLNE